MVILGILFFSLILFLRLSDATVKDTVRGKAQTSAITDAPPRVSIEKAQGKVISGIPDFPVYPGAHVEYSYIKREGKRTGYEIEWEAPAGVETLTKWYIANLPKYGWVLPDVPIPMRDSEVMIDASKNGRPVRLIIENEDGLPESEIAVEFPLQ